MATYVDGVKYLRNKDTGAVFPYRERIADLPHLEEVYGTEEGELVKANERKNRADPKLAPTQTPEKPEPEPVATTNAAPTKPPTLAPVAAK